MTSVLVVGGTNFIGPEVVRRLQGHGASVTVLHRGEREDDLGDAVHIHDDRAEIGRHARSVAPDVILDMAPIGAVHGGQVMSAAAGAGVGRVVAISSVDVYRGYDVVHGRDDRIQPTPFAEADDVRTQRYPYRDSFDEDHPLARYEKLDVEDAVLGSETVDGVVVRLPVVYGPKDQQRRLHPLLRRMDDGVDAIVLSESFAGWRFGKAHRSDAAAAIALACVHPDSARSIFNVGSFDGTELEWARAVGTALGWSGRFVAVPDDELSPDQRPDGDLRQDLVADSTRIRTRLGWTEVVGLAEGIREAAEWERSNPDPEFMYDHEAEAEVARRWAEGTGH